MERLRRSCIEKWLPGLGSEKLEFVERARPVLPEKAGESAVGKEFPARLAGWAIVGFVRSVTDALNFRATAGARLFVAPVNGHAFAERSHVLGELVPGFGAQVLDPMGKGCARRFEKTMNLRHTEFLRNSKRRKLCLAEDFV